MAKIKAKTVKFTLDNTNLETIKPPKFLEKMTTIHGINYFRVKSGRSLFTWTLLMIAHMIWTLTFLLIIKGRYKSDQIVTKIYSDWSVDNIPFPAVSICNYNMVSRNESKTIEKILSAYNVSREEIEFFFEDLYYLLDFGTGSLSVRNHSRVMDILKTHYYSINNIMEEVHQTCENLLVYCEFNGKPKTCVNVFSKIPTYVGYCCAFNFNGIDDEGADPMISPDDDFEYYNDRSEEGEEAITSIIATSQSGSSSGLRVVFNVEPEDYADWYIGGAYGAKIILSDPNDYVETRVLYQHITIGESVALKVEPMIFECDNNLRDVDSEKRGCWFHDEVNLVHTKRYSYETCNTECKLQSYKQYCGCVPYKYPADAATRVCEFPDLKCLHYMKVHWEATKIHCIPECYKECRDQFYTVVKDTVPFSAASASYPVDLSGRNASELASLHVYYIQPTCNCYMMSLLTDTNTFVATYGGIFSLCFGASILTICELGYLCLVSFAEMVWKMFICKFNNIGRIK